MDASPYCVLCEARPRDEWRQLCARKASPRVGPPTKKQCTPPSFVGGATRGEWRQLSARKILGPRPDIPLKAVHTALICGSRDPRRTAPARCPKSFAPGRASHKNSGARLPNCGRRDPQRMAPARCPKSFAPRSGLPLKAVHAAPIVGGAPSRRMAPARCGKSFGPTSAPPQKSSAHRPTLGSQGIGMSLASQDS